MSDDGLRKERHMWHACKGTTWIKIMGNEGVVKCSEVMILSEMCVFIIGFHLVAVVGKLVQKYERHSYILKKKQCTKQYKNREYTK